MANKIWRGDAKPVAQVVKITPATVEVGDRFTIKINGKRIDYYATSADGTTAAALVHNVVEGLAAAWNAATFPEATLITAEVVDSDSDSLSDYLTLTADNEGIPFRVTTETENAGSGNVTVVETTKGVSPVDERQKIELQGTYSGGTFTISWDPGGGTETTGNIAYNASAATVQTALEGLASVSAGDVVVSGSAGGPWFVTFQGTYAATDVALMSVDGTNLTGGGGVEIETTTPGTGATNEIWTLWVQESAESSISGTYTLSFDGETTGNIAYNASAATVQTALEGLATIGSGNVSVTGGQAVDGAGDGFFREWFFVVEFIGDLAGTNVSDLEEDFSSLFNGQVLTSGAQVGGVVAYEIQLVDLGQPSAGTFTLTYDGQTTAAIAYDAQDSAIETALEALSNLTNVFVRGPSGLFIVRFDGSPGSNMETLVLNSGGLTGATSPGVTVIQDGGASSGENEVQSVIVYATGGTFTLTYSGQTTGNIAYNASAGTVETAIEALSNITDVDVTGSGTPADPWLVEFVEPSGNVSEMTGDGTNLTGGGGTVSTIRDAVAAVDEVQTVTLDAGVSGGTFTLSLLGFETAAIAYNAAAAAVESALEALAVIDGCSVSGSAGGPWAVTFDGAFVTAQDVELMVADGSSLVGGSGTETLTLLTTTRSGGPNHFDDADNWTGEAVPDSQDSLYFAGGSVDCLYGLRQRSTFTANATTDVLTFGELCDFVENQKVRLFTTDTLPAGLSAATDYFILDLDYDAGTCKLEASIGGGAVNITDTGTGTHTIALHLTAATFHSRWSGLLGLQERNALEYYEYLPRSLACVIDTITVGEGEGDSQARLDIDTGNVAATTIVVHQTGGSAEAGLPAFRWKGTHAANSVTIHDGEFGVAVYATESAQINGLVMHAGLVQMGTVTLGSITKHGGELIAENVTLSGAMQLHG